MWGLAGHRSAPEAARESGVAPSTPKVRLAGGELRLRGAVARHSAFVWRVLVRFGVQPADAEDATQEVFLVLARQPNDVAITSERGFLLKVALGIASTRRRSRRRRPEELEETLDRERDSGPLPDQLVARLRLRRLLQQLLDDLPPEQRSVFVLVELEGLTVPEVAQLLELPLGTAASRLRRARQGLLQAVGRLGLTRVLEDFEYG